MGTLLYFLSIISAIIVLSNATEIQPCRGYDMDSIKDLKVQIGDCDKPPCEIMKGETFDFKEQFLANDDAEIVELIVRGTKFNGLYTSTLLYTTLGDRSACDHISAKSGGENACPLEKGETYIYHRTLEVGQTDRRVKNIPMEWYLIRGPQVLTCFRVVLNIN